MIYVELKELGEIVTGKTPPTENQSYYDGNYPFITPSDIDTFDKKHLAFTERTLSEFGGEKIKNCKLPAKSICFVCIGSTIGKMCMTHCDSFTNQQINSIIPNKKCDNDYLFYLLRHINEYFRMIGAGTGSGKGIVNKTVFSKTKIQIEENKQKQKQIANILSTYDELIENNNKRIAILEQMAENLYKEWIVHFRFPNHETTEFENGLPKGWKYVKFDDILSFDRGISYSSEEIDCEDGLNLINLKNIDAFGGFRRDGTKKYNGKYKESQVVKKGDLVIGVTDMTQDRRTVGAAALIPTIKGTSVISADLVKVVSDIPNIYLYCLCRYGFYSKYFSQFANGANVLHLKPGALLNKKVLLPTKDLIEAFVENASAIIELIDELNLANDNLIKQRDLLLPRLMSGKLEMPSCTEQKQVIKLSREQFVTEIKAAARAKGKISEDDLNKLYEAYCDDEQDEE